MPAVAQPRTVGLPRALGHHLHPALWETFLGELGVTVVLSAPTTRQTIERASLISETEHCLPVKLFDAHLDELAGRTDTIFVPRILSTRRDHIACPKLGALPDCARAQLPPGIRVLTVEVNERLTPLSESMFQLGRLLGAKPAAIRAAIPRALAAMAAAREEPEPDLVRQAPATMERLGQASPSTPDGEAVEGRACHDRHRFGPTSAQRATAGTAASPSICQPAPLRFLVIGHPYNLHDPYLGEPVFSTLAALGVAAGRVSFAAQYVAPEPLKWDTCSLIHDQLQRLDPAAWDGVIQLSSFNCGCDSISSPFFRAILTRKQVPFMTLVLDGHTARAGVETRLEAFVDSIVGRKTR